jgi:hypothetical protein
MERQTDRWRRTGFGFARHCAAMRRPIVFGAGFGDPHLTGTLARKRPRAVDFQRWERRQDLRLDWCRFEPINIPNWKA